MKLIEIYNTIKEEENPSKVDVNKAIKQGYYTVKFYKEADVPDNIKKLAIKIMTAINTVRRDLGTFDSTVHVYQQSIKENK